MQTEIAIPEIDDDDRTKVPLLEQKTSDGMTEHVGNRMVSDDRVYILLSLIELVIEILNYK